MQKTYVIMSEFYSPARGSVKDVHQIFIGTAAGVKDHVHHLNVLSKKKTYYKRSVPVISQETKGVKNEQTHHLLSP